ncbi:MAG: nucleotidyltransferase domain-containing protein [Candidatus Eisenbacteria bacterium]|nr:nucleotidyltransferase domain-containing protein [Candidatus Eisenbacteria bacterium]
MDEQKKSSDYLLWFLRERAKELNCLYEIEELLNRPDADIDEVCRGIIRAIPPGWQYPDHCMAKVTLGGRTHTSPNFKETPWVQSADIVVEGRNVGTISVYYSREMPRADDGPFLKEETRLLDTIVDRMGHFIVYSRMKEVFHEYQTARKDLSEHKVEEWKVALNLLRRTDHDLFLNISRRMLNFLCWSGIKEAEQFLQRSVIDLRSRDESLAGDDNRPYQKNVLVLSDTLSDEIFGMAARHATSEQILSNIQKWIREERLGFLAQLANQNPPIAKVIDAIRRYHHVAPEGIGLPPATKRGVQVSLIRRFLSDQPQFISNAIDFVEIDDFYDILDRILYLPESQGKLGGKSAGLFLAERVLRTSSKESTFLGDIKVPKTWYITSDGLPSFLAYNNLNEVLEQKYKDINQVRLEYPHVIQTFKNAEFSTEIIQGLSMVLDDFERSPLIVRSSSLLEDRSGSSFSGKYKSLFLANQGSKQERLEALTDAIAEVYASVFGPDPISYRAERGLLDFAEEMGIMIEEVVGTKVGDYFMPSFAGVAFSRNEFCWSPRIKATDGLIRLVPGLGTRAVDRTSDDYPVLIAPGQPDLRVNVTLDEIVRYAPKKVDVINLKTNTFETIEVKELFRKAGDEIPAIEKIVSIFDGQQIRKPVGKNVDFDADDLVVTFDGLISDTHFVDQVQGLLTLLERKLRMPVDIEFASDGKDFYLLQCRPQSYVEGSRPAPIPKDIQKKRILFTANRYVSNGRMPEITHIVYIDPRSYDELSDLASLTAVGRAVGKLNKLLPRRKFVLMGPGRWGSKGDIKLGVKVTYSDINNTALLIEIARKKGKYLPDLSFGTHFFQDLVEAEIRYLPLYPDHEGTIFNEAFFRHAKNILPDVLPEFRALSDTIKLIEVPKATDGLILRVLMNAELDEAIGFLAEPSVEMRSSPTSEYYGEKQSENFWAWRLEMAEHIASQLDPERFGVSGFYVFGSTKNATAGPSSDIDILIHFQGTEEQHEDLLLWLEGWSLALEEINYLRTGYRTTGLLDIHVVTDEDIAQKTSYAAKIGAITDPARPLQLMKRELPSE